LSRALGDFEFKQNYGLEPEKQIVTADPDILTHKVDGEEEFLVLACDGERACRDCLCKRDSDAHYHDGIGIWDCLSSQQVVDFIRRAVANGDALTKICEDLMVKCLAPDSELGGIGCDNMTVVIVALLNGRTLEEWQEWVKKRVDEKGQFGPRVGRIAHNSAYPPIFSTQLDTTRQSESPTSLVTQTLSPFPVLEVGYGKEPWGV
jgi:protein phosphatase 2C family protein 2/3